MLFIIIEISQTLIMATNMKRIIKKRTIPSENTHNLLFKDHYEIARSVELHVRGPTGIVTDDHMLRPRCLWDENYQECPERLSSVLNRCEELGLISTCKRLTARKATLEELSTLHDSVVYQLLTSTSGSQDQQELEKISARYDAIYVHPETHEAALLAAGSSLELVRAVLEGEVQNGFALVRPPGHHAMRAEPCGYCFYNNAALAARSALDAGLERILIVDWDVHHGQATQQMFYDDPRVVYFSVHRYEHGAFWPNLRQSDWMYTGRGAGIGFNFNVPLNVTGVTDVDYLAIWQRVLLPMAFKFSPQLILISAGYDAALGCPEGEMSLSPACYAHLLQQLLAVCSRICVFLEGGYCLKSLAEAAALTLRTLLGKPPPLLQPLSRLCPEVEEAILNCVYSHRTKWNCYGLQPTYFGGGGEDSIGKNDNGKNSSEEHRVHIRWLGDETRPDTFPTQACHPIQSPKTKRHFVDALTHLQLTTELSVAPHGVCYAYDEGMLIHRNLEDPCHVERPERILCAHSLHEECGLLNRMHFVPTRAATDLEILLLHSEKYLTMLKELNGKNTDECIRKQRLYDSVFLHPETLLSARIAAGTVMEMVDWVCSGRGESGVCVVRPPGHHAAAETPSGFCLLNNVALAARFATDQLGLDRVLILDWDVHHGNGTQSLLEQDPRVLYMSLHRYDHAKFFPHSTAANFTEIGSGAGRGFNVNIPWNKSGMGDVEYLTAFTQVVLPIAYEFSPQLVLISAGFDACVGDPLGGCKVSPECFGRMTTLLRGLAGGRIVLCLEGGYNTTGTAHALVACTKALLGDPLPLTPPVSRPPHPLALESLRNVLASHAPYWTCIEHIKALPADDLQEPPPSRGLEPIDTLPDHPDPQHELASSLSQITITS